MDKSYFDTVRLLLDVAPEVFASGPCSVHNGQCVGFVPDFLTPVLARSFFGAPIGEDNGEVLVKKSLPF